MDPLCFGYYVEKSCYVCKFNCKQRCMDFSSNSSGIAEKPYQVKIVTENQNTKNKVFRRNEIQSKCPECGEKSDNFNYFMINKKVKFICEDCGKKLKD